jgi:tetratricopeptide (TPR) repeat protein
LDPGEEMHDVKTIIFAFLTISFISCAYFNTLFNAQQRYDDGVKKIEESKDKKITSEIRNDFQAAIDKCWKLLNIYSDSSKYADDALLIIGKSHFQIEEYVKSERFLAQFVDRYKDSDMIAEAYLWLGMSLLELDRDDESLEYFNRVLTEDESDELNARAHLNIGRIYLKQENYDQARKQLAEVFNITRDDEIQSNAQFQIAETFHLEGNYPESITNFEKVFEYDASADLLFRAILNQVDGYLNLEEYDQAILTLESITSETKFLHKKSVVLALIGNCYEVQGKFIEATDIYYDVLETYPRTEGSAIAAYGMAQLMEFAYADLDSAKGLYSRVGREYRDSEYKADADARVKVLSSYQKIVQNIEKDINDLHELTVITAEEELVSEDSEGIEEEEITKNDQRGVKNPKGKRSESDIRKSLEKNSFAKAEFFLLTLASYDSAAAGYNRFIQSSNDSLLVPKAQYALYYIYAYELYDEARADSIKIIILDLYPSSPYASFFNAQDNTYSNVEQEESQYNYLYLQGEAMMYDSRYYEAIEFFNQIAIEDSGSDLAQKARYAAAWIYENKLEEIENAVTAYAALAKEYPNTKAGKIAHNKIQEPPQVVELDTSAAILDSTNFIDSTAVAPSLEEKMDISDQNIEDQEQDEQNVPTIPDDQQ